MHTCALCVHTHVHWCMCTDKHAHNYIRTHRQAGAFMGLHADTHAHTHSHTHTYTHTRTNTRKHARTHTHTHTSTSTHTYTHVPAPACTLTCSDIYLCSILQSCSSVNEALMYYMKSRLYGVTYDMQKVQVIQTEDVWLWCKQKQAWEFPWANTNWVFRGKIYNFIISVCLKQNSSRKCSLCRANFLCEKIHVIHA